MAEVQAGLFRLSSARRRAAGAQYPRRHGEAAGTRTQDPRLKRPLLYLLSYRPASRGTASRKFQRRLRRGGVPTRDCLQISSTTPLAERLQNSLDIAESVGEPLPAVGVVRVERHVVGHEHVGVVHIPKRLRDCGHVHVSFVGIDLFETVAASADVAEVDVEDFLLAADAADDLVDFRCRVLQHFRRRAQQRLKP